MIQFDHAIRGDDSLLRNMTFGMNMGHDEIGFSLRVWRTYDEVIPVTVSTQLSLSKSSDMMIIIGITILLMILGGGTWVVIRRRRLSVSHLPPVPYGDRVVEESPVIVSSVILPQDIPPAVPTDVVTSPIVESTLSVQDVTSESK